jgi:hypothetical protein
LVELLRLQTRRRHYATTNGILLGIPHSKGDVRLVAVGEACRTYETATLLVGSTPITGTGSGSSTFNVIVSTPVTLTAPTSLGLECGVGNLAPVT